jgi:uncharacterized protein (DUF952 family)/uncharacterized protein YbbK (DUF523 family)
MPHLPTDPDALEALREPTAHHPWRVLVSGCMLGTRCGWQGDDNGMSGQTALQRLLAHPHVTPVPACPEHAAIGTPRGIPDLYGGDGFDVLDGTARVRVDDEQDVTDALLAASVAMAERAETCDLALLVDTSATCGSQITAAGNRWLEETQRQAAPGIVAALLWERRIPFASHRDFRVLATLQHRLDGTPVPDDARDHHEHPWFVANLPGPWSRTERALARRQAVSARRPVVKILDRTAWDARDDTVPWAPIDHADGFLHLSADHQVARTLELHFAGRTDLVRVVLDAARIPNLVWEPSRDGQLFPHVYGQTPLSAVVAVEDVPPIPG